MIVASSANAYTGSPVDRVSHLRDDGDWVAGALADPATLWAPVWRARSLMRGEAPQAVFVPGSAAAALRGQDGPWALLGRLENGAPLFAIDISDTDEPSRLLPDGVGEFVDLRGTVSLLPARDAAILAHARGLMHWRARHRFCANCGQAVEPRHAGNATQCPACGTQHFPRTDPAVIMLVSHGEGPSAKVLLGHSQRFPTSTMYSTLAGFVEPGESLEEAVIREVFEESGVRVAEVTYHSSQPWPFPASIMLGFYARALTEDIVIEKTELADVRWFTREQLRDTAAHGFMLPRGDSIARRLIEDWIAA